MLPDQTFTQSSAKTSAASIVAIAALLIVAPIVLPSAQSISTLSFVVILAAVAYSVNVSYRFTGILMIAQGAVWGVGAYTGGLLHNRLQWTFWEVLAPAAAAGMIAAVLVAMISLRSRGHYFLIVTFAINEFIVLVGNKMSLTGGQRGLVLINHPDALGSLQFNSPIRRYYLFAAFLLLIVVVIVIVRHAPLGRRLVAVRENENLAQAVGIPIRRSQLKVLAIGGAIAGLAGALYLYQQRAIEPDLFGAISFLQVVLMVVLGGRNTESGPLIGALVLLFLPQVLGLSPVISQLVYGLLLVAVILLAPQGIAGTTSAYARKWTSTVRHSSATSAPTTKASV